MNIYFCGIGGVGLGPLAQLAIDSGHTVLGSDLAQSLTTEELQSQGVNIRIGPQSSDHLREMHIGSPIDWFVYTAGLPTDHPELTTAIELGIKTSKRDGLLANIISDSHQKLIAVSGTHGKTTTTAMFVWAFGQLGIPISYSIGSQIGFGPSGKFVSGAEYFVYECDEFDRNFLHFKPHLSVIVSADYDHPDTYPTEKEYKSAFRQFIQQSDATILWQHDAEYIGNKEPSTWCLLEEETIDVPLAGEHNRRNATLVLKSLERLNVGQTPVNLRTLSSFPGTARRFENISENLYSDYGHHPVEIAATLQMARELNNHVVLVYQPHQNIRQHEIRDQYTDLVFKHADEVYWLPTYLSREDPNLEVLSPKQLTSRLASTRLSVASLDDNLWKEIAHHREAGQLVVCMGAGSIDSWLRTQL